MPVPSTFAESWYVLPSTHGTVETIRTVSTSGASGDCCESVTQGLAMSTGGVLLHRRPVGASTDPSGFCTTRLLVVISATGRSNRTATTPPAVVGASTETTWGAVGRGLIVTVAGLVQWVVAVSVGVSQN